MKEGVRQALLSVFSYRVGGDAAAAAITKVGATHSSSSSSSDTHRTKLGGHTKVHRTNAAQRLYV